VRDPDLAETFAAAHATPAGTDKIVVYGISPGDGFSTGLAVFVDPHGKAIGHSGWRMRVGFTVQCSP
jgi:hypothetical protein